MSFNQVATSPAHGPSALRSAMVLARGPRLALVAVACSQHSLSLHKHQPIAGQFILPRGGPKPGSTQADLGPHGQDAPEKTPGGLADQAPPKLSTTHCGLSWHQSPARVLLRGVTPAPSSPTHTPVYPTLQQGNSSPGGAGAFGKQRSDFRIRAGEAASPRQKSSPVPLFPQFSLWRRHHV